MKKKELGIKRINLKQFRAVTPDTLKEIDEGMDKHFQERRLNELRKQVGEWDENEKNMW